MTDAESLQVALTPKADPRLKRLRASVQLLHLLALVLGMLVLVYLAFAYWNIVSGVALAAGRRPQTGPLLPLILATLGSWSIMYLLHDKVGILGSASARTLLKPRATEQVQREPALAQHFVEVRPQGRKAPIQADWGWLLVFPERLEFVGERQSFRLERRLVAGSPRREPNTFGLLPSWLDLPLRTSWKGLALLGRDSATSLSDTVRDTEALQVSLLGWLNQPVV